MRGAKSGYASDRQRLVVNEESRSALRVRRRIFLSALGLGLTATAASRLSSVALAQPTTGPKRFMIFYMPHGVPPEHHSPVVMNGDPTNFTFTRGVSILGPLEEKFKSYTNVIQGLQYPGAMTHEGIISCLSGITTFNGGSVDETTPRTTVEHVIANGLGVSPLVLGACAARDKYGNGIDSKLFWDGTAVVPEKDPAAAYDAVFSNLGGPVTPDPNVELTEALRALTEGEVAGLKAELSALTAEQTKLQTHLEAIQALKAGGSLGTVSCTEAPQLPAVDTARAAGAGQPEDFFFAGENFPMLLEAQLQIAAAAMVCNARSVVAVQPMYANCEIDFGFMGSNGGHHSTLSHTGPSQTGPGTFDPATRTPFANAQRWFAQQLVTHVLEKLLVPDPADPTHTVLDNTIVYWMSEIGECADHTTFTKEILRGAPPGVTAYLPLVTIGGGGGALKTGQVLTFAPDRPAGDLYLSLAQAMGVSGASFGDAKSPIAEVLA